MFISDLAFFSTLRRSTCVRGFLRRVALERGPEGVEVGRAPTPLRPRSICCRHPAPLPLPSQTAIRSRSPVDAASTAMLRLGLALALLQGSLFTALANEVTPTPQSEHEKNLTDGAEPPLYQFGNKDGEPCILMEMEAYVAIKSPDASNETKEIDMFVEQSKVLTTGSCTDDEVDLSMTWKSFHLRWNFAKTRDWKKWFAKQVELQYDKSGMDNKIVNGTTGMSSVSTRGSSDVMLFSAPMGQAYHCPSEYELELVGDNGDNATLRLRSFRVQPFVNYTFGPSYCPTHTTGEDLTSTTDSSDFTTPGITKANNSSPMDTSGHSNGTTPKVMNSTATPISVASPVPSSATHRPVNSTAISPSGANYRPHPASPTPSSVWSALERSTAVTSDSHGSSTHHEIVPTYRTTRAPTTHGPFGTSLPPYAYQKAFPNVIKMPFYPPKKVFFSGVKMDDNEALSAMLWSWYTSGFYTGYYQAQQQSKKIN